MEKRLAFRLLLKTINPNIGVSEIHKGDVLSHLQQQYKARSGNAANKDRKNFIAAWGWRVTYIKCFPSENPFNVARFPETRHPRVIPFEDQFWKIVQVAENEQDRLMLYCFLHLAARRNEIFSLKWSDINFEDKKIRLFTRKRRDGSSEHDWLPMTEFLFKELKLHREKRNDDLIYVFPNPRKNLPYVHREKWMKRICLLANVPPFGLHAIRHLSASILMKNDVPLVDIKTILRHKSIANTERYFHHLKSVRESIMVFDGLLENPRKKH